MKGDKLGRQAGSGSQERNHEGSQADHRQGSSCSQKRNHEGRQAWKTRRQRLAKSEIMKGDKLGRQGGSGSQER